MKTQREHVETGLCRLCSQEATQSTRYVVVRENVEYASVTHATCARHAAGLRRDMIEAGWIEAEPDDGIIGRAAHRAFRP
jgi:hypothetical protein